MSFQSLLDHFYTATGIEFKENREIVNRKVTQFYEDRGYKDYHDFFSTIKTNKQLYQDLINLLTTSETYFYRELHQIDFCVEIAKNKAGTIKILSAPCASGEEPYSLLIAMLEANIDLNKIQIYAFDINTQEVNKAKEGVFAHRRLHKLSAELQKKYFTVLDDGTYKIIPDLQKHVHFKQMNLFEPFSAEFSNFDLIFSRNMLIYFDKKAQEQAERIFCDRLKSGGLLFLGHADKIHNVTDLKFETKNGTSYYKKL